MPSPGSFLPLPASHVAAHSTPRNRTAPAVPHPQMTTPSANLLVSYVDPFDFFITTDRPGLVAYQMYEFSSTGDPIQIIGGSGSTTGERDEGGGVALCTAMRHAMRAWVKGFAIDSCTRATC